MWYATIICIVGGAVLLVGAVNLTYQIYNMTKLDAESRGLKHPKLWGLFSLSGEGGGGLILYLIGRRNYVSNISMEGRREMDLRKKKAGLALIFIVIGAIIMAVGIFLQSPQ